MFYLASPSPERRAASCWRCACRARPSSDRSNRRSPSTQPRSRQRPPRVSPRSCGRRAPILARQRPYRRRRKPKRKGTDGFVPWTEADMTAYEARWLIGTRQRVWLDLLAYTGLRRGDVVRLGAWVIRANGSWPAVSITPRKIFSRWRRVAGESSNHAVVSR